MIFVAAGIAVILATSGGSENARESGQPTTATGAQQTSGQETTSGLRNTARTQITFESHRQYTRGDQYISRNEVEVVDGYSIASLPNLAAEQRGEVSGKLPYRIPFKEIPHFDNSGETLVGMGFNYQSRKFSVTREDRGRFDFLSILFYVDKITPNAEGHLTLTAIRGGDAVGTWSESFSTISRLGPTLRLDPAWTDVDEVIIDADPDKGKCSLHIYNLELQP